MSYWSPVCWWKTCIFFSNLSRNKYTKSLASYSCSSMHNYVLQNSNYVFNGSAKINLPFFSQYSPLFFVFICVRLSATRPSLVMIHAVVVWIGNLRCIPWFSCTLLEFLCLGRGKSSGSVVLPSFFLALFFDMG